MASGSGDIRDWFTNDELESLHRTESRTSHAGRRSLRRRGSMDSMLYVVPNVGKIDLSLSDLCIYVDTHPSLDQAEIVATECHTESAGAVTHRFLIVELHRPDKKAMFLRLDRRRGEGVSVSKFIFWSGKTKANDVAQLTLNKSIFTKTSQFENRQTFSMAPTLGMLRRFLHIVIGELTSYKIWPENCWFFCSMIQEYLQWSHGGRFEGGTRPSKPELGTGIRLRILRRVFSAQPGTPGASSQDRAPERGVVILDASTQLNSISASLPLMELPASENEPRQHVRTDGVLHVVTSADSPNTTREDLQSQSETEAESVPADPHNQAAIGPRPQLPDAEQSHSVSRDSDTYTDAQEDLEPRRQAELPDPSADATPLLESSNNSDSQSQNFGKNQGHAAVKQEIVDIRRQLYKTNPEKHRVALAASLSELGPALFDLGQHEEARAAHEESVGLRRQLYAANPQAHGVSLARELYNLGIALHGLHLYEDARASKEESVALYRQLYAANPQKHGAGASLAQALCSLGVTLHEHELDLDEEARDACEEAVALRRTLYAVDPEAHGAPLARELCNLGVAFHSLHLYKEACAKAEEAVGLYRQCYAADPEAHGAALAWALHVLEYYNKSSGGLV